MTPDPRWEALRKAAQALRAACREDADIGNDTRGPIFDALLATDAALAALEEPATAVEDAGDVACYHHGMGQLSGLTTAAEMADKWATQYPTDVFLPDGTSIEARAAHHARRVAGFIAKDIRDLIAECSEPAPDEAPQEVVGCSTPGCGFQKHDLSEHPCGQPLDVSAPSEVPDRGDLVDADALVVPPFYTEKPLSIHDKCDAEVAALRAERDEAVRSANLLQAAHKTALEAAAAAGKKWQAAEAALATERARALDPSRIIAVLDKHADKCIEYFHMNGYVVHGEERTVIWNQMSALLSELSASPPPAPAPKGEERS